MKKTFEENGKVCEVIIVFDAHKKTFTGTHNITHDDYSKQISMHQITAFVDGVQVFKDEVRADSETDVMLITRAAEQQAKQYANLRAVSTSNESARAMLTRIGYSE
jgi:hypothetical protein